jgi:acyl-CoA thioesterase-1
MLPWRSFLQAACGAGLSLLLIVTVGACGTPDAARTGDTAPAAQGAPPAAEVPAAPARDQAEAGRKVVVLGDSLTAGLGLVDTQAYPALLQKKIDQEGLRFAVVNAGISGDTSAGGLRRLDWALQDRNVRVLIVALGANDGLRGLPVAEMKQNLARIIEVARARNIAVILAGMEAPPNYGGEYASSFRQAYHDLAREHRVVFVPFLLDKVAGHAALNQGDGIHPNAAGAAIIADNLWTALKPLLDQIAAS